MGRKATGTLVKNAKGYSAKVWLAGVRKTINLHTADAAEAKAKLAQLALDGALIRRARKRNANQYRVEDLTDYLAGVALTSAVVYYVGVENGSDAFVKIGTVGALFKLPHRISNLQTGCPFKISLLALEPGGPALERARHEKFAKHRASGEWFYPTPELIKHMASLLSQKRVLP